MSSITQGNFLLTAESWKQQGNQPITLPELVTLPQLNWTVVKEPLITSSGMETNSVATIRVNQDGSRLLLGDKLTPDYQIVQNPDIFSFLEPLLDTGLCKIDGAGTIGQGRKVYASLEIENLEANVKPGDSVKGYFMVATSHDGTLSLSFLFTPIRMLCGNRLNRALAPYLRAEERNLNLGGIVRLKHTAKVFDNMKKIQEAIDLVNRQFAVTLEQYKELAKTTINKRDLEDYFTIVFSTKSADEALKEDANKSRVLKTLLEVHETAPGQSGNTGNLWGAYNAVTYYTNHVRGNAGTGEQERLGSVTFGLGKQINAKAFDKALAMARS